MAFPYNWLLNRVSGAFVMCSRKLTPSQPDPVHCLT